MRVVHVSINMNEVIRAVLNFVIYLFIFLQKKLLRTQKIEKEQNTYKRTKIKKAAFFMRLKNILFAYLRFCAFA